MGDLVGFLQLAVGLAALYVSIYFALKKKYEKLRELHLNVKQFIKKSNKIKESVGFLNTIYIIITLIIISLYFSPFKGFFQFFEGDDFNTSQGKNIYIVSSVISSLILLYFIIKISYDIDILDCIYQYLFCAFIYIFDIIVLLKINQFALSYYTKTYEESLIDMHFRVFITHFFIDFILIVVYMFSYFGYIIFIDFLNDKFTE